MKCHVLDLNLFNPQEDLKRKYNAIVPIEIIEHLQSPLAFLRNVPEALSPGGVLFLTSPNIYSWHSRLRFLRHGVLDWFGEFHFEEVGHIHPVLDWHIPVFGKKFGLELVRAFTGNDRMLRKKRLQTGSIRMLFKAYTYFYLALRPFMKGDVSGENRIWVLRKV